MKFLPMVGLLSSLIAPSLLASVGSQLIVTKGHDPACYQLSNTAVYSAIDAAEVEAKTQCENPILVSLKVDIKNAGGCTPVTAIATYNCLDNK